MTGFVPEWQRELRRQQAYRRRARRDDKPVDGYDYAGEIARLDASVTRWKRMLELERETRRQEQIDRLEGAST